MKISRTLITIIILLTIFSNSFSQKTWDGGGDGISWSDGVNWNPDGVPINTDDVTIGSGYAVTVDAAAQCLSLTIANNAANTSVTFNSGITMNVDGIVAFGNPSANNITQIISVGDATLNCLGVTMPDTDDNSQDDYLDLNDGTITVSGDIIMTNGNRNRIRVTGVGIINVSGTFSGGNFNRGSSTVNYNGAGDQTIWNYAYYNLHVSNGGVKSLRRNIILYNNLILDNIIDLNNYQLRVYRSNIITNTSFGNTVMIDFQNGGNLRIDGTNNTHYETVYPIGINGVYTPIEFTSVTGSDLNGYLQIILVDSKHPLTDGSDNAITKFWEILTSGLTLTSIDGYFQYDDLDVAAPITEASLTTVGRLNSGVWQTNEAGTSYNHATNRITLTGVSAIAGTWTLGENTGCFDGTLPDVYTIATGNWNQTYLWSTGALPNVGDNVAILHRITLNVAATVNDFTVSETGYINLNNQNFTVDGTTDVSGEINDWNNNGTNTFTGHITVNSGGEFLSARNSLWLFGGGITNNGNFSITGTGAKTINTSSQVIDGANAVTINGNTTIASGLSVTNRISETNSGLSIGGAWEGADATSQFINEAVLSVTGQNGPMRTSGVFDADFVGSMVKYTRNATQYITPVTYHDLLISCTNSANKYLEGTTIVNDDLQLLTTTDLYPRAYDLTVNDSTFIAGRIYDDDAVGTLVFNELDLSGGQITGSRVGNYIINGNLIIPSDNGLIGAGNFTINGVTRVNTGLRLSFNNANGTKTFVDSVIIEAPAGEWVNTGNEAIEFRNGLHYNGSTFTSGTGVYSFTTNNQSITGSSAITFSDELEVGAGVILSNMNTNVTTGITITGDLLGVNAGSVYENRGVTTYLNYTLPMAIGSIDANTFSNTFNYNLNNQQLIKATDYDSLIFSNSGNKILQDSTTVNGGFTTLDAANTVCGVNDFTFLGSVTNNTSGTFTTGLNTVSYGRSGNQDIIIAPYGGELFTYGSGTKTINGDISVSGDMSVGGTSVLDLNTHTLTSSGDITTNNGATFNVGPSAQLEIANTQTITNNGIFNLVGDASNNAILTRNGATGGYSVIQSAVGAVFNANYFELNYTSGGVNLSAGQLNSTNNFSNGLFSNGSGTEYLNLTGIDLTGLPAAANTVFNAGPTYNVTRTSGTGAITFEDASGALAGESFDNDNGNPGTLINWTYPASTYYSVASGVSAGLTASWNTNPDGTSGSFPANTTDGLSTFIIQDGHTVIVDNNGDINALAIQVGQGTSGTLRIGSDGTQRIVTIQERLEVQSGATLNAGSQGAPAHTLRVYGNIINNGTINLKPSASVVNTEVYGNSSIQGSSSPLFNDLICKTGSVVSGDVSLDVDGSFYIEAGAEFDDAGNSHYLAKNWSVQGAGLYTASGTIVFNGNVNTINDNLSGTSISFNNLTFSGIGVGSVQENLIVNGDFQVINGRTFTAGNNSLTYNGDFRVEAGATYTQSANYTVFGGTNTQTIDLLGTIDFYALNFINGGSNAKTVNGNIHSDNLTIISNGATVTGAGTHTLDNGFRINGTCNFSGVIRMMGGTLYTYDAGNSLTLGTARLDIEGNVWLGYGGAATSLTANVNNDVNIITGYLVVNNNTFLNGLVANTLSLAADRSLYVRGSDNFPSGFGTFSFDETSYIRYDAPFDQTVRGGITYGRLYLSNSATTKTVDGSIDVDGYLYLRNQITLDLQSFSHTFSHNVYNNSNSSIDGTNATVTFDAIDINQRIEANGTGEYNFNNLYFLLNNPGAVRVTTFYSGCTINIIGGDFEVTNAGGTASTNFIINLNDNSIGASPNNFNLGEYCRIYTTHPDFGAGVTDNFSNVNMHLNSLIYYSLNGAQIIADGFIYGSIGFNTGDKTARGALDINSNIYRITGTPVFYDAGFTHTVAGDWFLNNTAYYTQSSATGTIVFDGVDQDIQGVNFNNITIANSGTATQVNNLNIFGNLQVNAGGIIDCSTKNIFLGGNFNIIGNGLFSQTTGITTFNGVANQTISSNATSRIGQLRVNKPNVAGLQLVSVLSELYISGSTQIFEDAGVLDISNQDVYFGANLEVFPNTVEAGQTFISTGSNAFFNGADMQYIRNSHINPLIFNNITFSNSGTKMIDIDNDIVPIGNRAMEVNGNFTINGSIVNASAWDGGMDIYVRGNWDNTGGFQHNNNRTVYFDGNNDQTISSSAFWNLDIRGTGTKTLLGNISAYSNLTISAATLDANNNNISVDGNWDNTAVGAIFTPGTGKVTFNGGHARIYTGTDSGPAAGKSFYDVDINKNTSYAFLGGDFDVRNNLNIISGYFRTDTNSVWLGGNFTCTGIFQHNNNVSLFTFNAGSGTKTIDANDATFRGIEVNAPGATYRLQSDMRFTNENFTLTDGTFILNENQLSVQAYRDSIIINGGVFDVDSNSTVYFNSSNQAIELNAGVLRLVGIESKPATLNRTAGNFYLNQNGGIIHAQNYLIRNGRVVISGGLIDATNNFSNGTFAAGSGNAYLTLTGLNFADFIATNVSFNTGPTYNVSRTSGTGVITFEDASGSLAGENYDEDNGDPGTLIEWTYPAGFYWDNDDGTDDWNDPNNWSGNVVPTATDIVYLDHTFVAGAYTVNITSANAIALRVLMDEESTGNAIELVLQNSYDLDVDEHIEIKANTTITVSDNTSIISVGRNWSNLGTFNHGNSTVIFNGNGGNYTINSGGIAAGKSFYNITFNAPSTTYNLGSACDVDNNLTISNGSFELTAAAYDINVGGNWYIDQANGGSFDAATADVVFDGVNQSIINGTFYNLLSAGSGIKTINSNIAVDNDLTIGVGTTVDGLTNNIYVTDDWFNNGAFTQTGLGTVIFNGTGGQVIDNGTNPTDFNNISFINAGGKTFYNASNVNGTFTINGGSGMVNVDTYTINGVGASNTLTNFGRLQISGVNNFPTGFETLTLASTSSVYYLADIDQNIFPTTYGNLFLRGNIATPTTKTADGDLIITGYLDIDDRDSTTLDLATNDVDIILTGGLRILPDCDIIWGSGSSTIEHVGANWYVDADLDSLNNVILAGTGDKYLQGDIIIGGDVTIKANIDLMMYHTGDRADYHTMTGNAANTITLEQSARILCTTPTAVGPAIPEGFGNYIFDDNSSYYLYSPAGVNQTLYSGANYGNLYFYDPKNVTSDGVASLDVEGNLDMQYSTYFDNGEDIYVAGTYLYLTNYAASDTSISIVLDGIQNQYIRDNRGVDLTIPKLVLSGAGVKSIGDGNDVVTIDGSLIVDAGVRGTSYRNILFNGYKWNNNGIYQQTGNTVTFNGGANQYINPGASNPLNYFRNIIFENSSTKTFITNGADINGTLTINAGTVDLGTVNHTISGTITNTAGGTLISASANLTLDGGTQNVNSPSFAINNISTSGSGYKRLFSDWTINGDLIIGAGTYLETDPENNNTPPHYNINIKGNWLNNGTFIDRAAKVVFDGATSPINITTNGSNFYDLEFAPTAAVNYNLQSPVNNVTNTLVVGANANLNLNSTRLSIGRYNAANTVSVNGTLTIDENATLDFDNRTTPCVLNVAGRLELIGVSTSELAILSRNNGNTGTEVNILSGGVFAAHYYLIERLDENGINMQSGSTLDAINNLSDGTWSNIPTTANARYITLEAGYSGDTIRNISFNYVGTPTEGNSFNVWRQTATPDIVFDNVTGNLGSYLYEKDEEATPSSSSGKLQWPAITLSNWTGAVNTDWHVAGNWDNGVPTASVDAIIPDRLNDPIISNANAVCKNLTIIDGTLELDNNRLLTTSGDVTIGTSTNVGILAVNTTNSEITVGGQWTRGSNAVFQHGNSTVVFNSSAGSTTISPRTSAFYNVVFNNTLTTFYLTGTTITILNDFSILAGTVSPTSNNYNYNVYGNIDFSGGAFTPLIGGVTVGTVSLLGGNQSITSGSFNNLQVSGSATKTVIDSMSTSGITTIYSILTAGSGSKIDFNGNVVIDAIGTFNDGDETHTFGGAIWKGSGTYSGNGTIVFDADNLTQSIYRSSFYNLDIHSENRRLYLQDSVSIGNNLTFRNTIDYAYLYDNVFTNSSGLGTFTIEDNTRMYLLGADNFPKGFATNNLDITSTVYYRGAINQIVSGVSYGILRLEEANTKTLSGNTEVKGRLLMYNDPTLDVSVNNYTLTIGGHFYNETGTFICRQGEVILNGDGNNQGLRIGGTNDNIFYDITVNKPSGYTYSAQNTSYDFIVQNNLKVLSGQFYAAGRTLYIGGDLTATGTGSFYNNSGLYYLNKTSGTAIIRVNGSSFDRMTINSTGGAVYTAQDDITLIGDFNLLAGTFNGNGKTITLGNGSSDAINIFGTYQVGAGGTLSIGYATSLTVDAAASIEVVGSSSAIARVTRNNGGRYNFTVNGNIAARYYLFEYMNSTGIYLSSTATIHAINNFSDGTFTRGATSGQLLRVENTQSFQDPNYISNVSFPVNPGGSGANVAKFTETSGNLEFYNASGVFAGETYDEDPSNLIHWTGPITLTWNGSVSTDWNDSLNWTASFGPPIVPTGNENVFIAAATNQPILDTTGQITASLNIESGASVTLNTPFHGGGIDLDINGDITIENGGSLVLSSTNDYLNIEGSWTKEASGTTIMSGNVTFDGSGGAKTINNGNIPFFNLIIGGYSQYQLGVNTYVNNNFIVNDTSTFDVTSAAYSLTVKGDFLNDGTFLSQNGRVNLIANSGPRTIRNASTFNNLDINASGVTYQLAGSIAVNGNLNIIAGTLDVAANTLSIGNGVGSDYINVAGTLNLNANASLNMGNNSQINVNSGGTMNLVGTDNANRATVSSQSGGRYSFDINSGGTIAARFYNVEYTDPDGLHINSGASVHTLNNLSDGQFSNGSPVGGTYIKLSHEPAVNDTLRNIVFNTGPVYNVSRTSGTAIFFFQDASGALGTYDYEQDNEAPDPSSGLIQWPFLNTNIWMGGIDTDWHKAGNWSGGIVPDLTNNAVISATALNNAVISSGVASAKNITVEAGVTLTISQNLTVAENILYNDDVIATGSPTITIGENWTDNGGSFTPGNSSVLMNTASGTKDIDMSTGSFYNLEIDASGAGYIIYNNLNVNNDLTITNGELNLSGFDIYVGGGLSNNDILTVGTSLVTFNGAAGIHNIDAPGVNFYNIVINSSTGNASYLLSDNINITANFTISDGIFDLSPDGGTTSYNLTIGNRFTNTQGEFFAREGNIQVGENWNNSVLGTINPGTSTVTFVSGSGTRSIASGGDSFYNLTLNGGATFRILGDLDVNNNLNISVGNLDLATGPSYNIIIGGNWSNSGTFIPRAGRVSFDGTTQTITTAGGETFYDFEGNSSSLTLNNNVTITNAFTFTSGVIHSQSYTLMLGTNTSNTGSLSYTAGAITGKFERWLNTIATDYIFPIGTSASYNPATIQFVTNLTDGSVVGEFIASNPGTAGLPVSDGIIPVDGVFTEGFWRFIANNSMASTDYNITLDGNGFSSQTFEATNRVLKRTNVSNWDVDGTHVDAVGTNIYRNSLNGVATTSTDFCIGTVSCVGGTIGRDSTICENDSYDFSNILAPSGGVSYTYTWQQTNDLSAVAGDASWTDISSSNVLELTNHVVADTTMYIRRAVAGSGCPAATYSNTVTVNTYHVPVTGPVYHIKNEYAH